MPIPIIFCKSLFVLLTHNSRVCSFAKYPFKEVNVTGVMYREELPRGRVRHDYNTALPDEWFSFIHVEEIAEAEASDEYGVHY